MVQANGRENQSADHPSSEKNSPILLMESHLRSEMKVAHQMSRSITEGLRGIVVSYDSILSSSRHPTDLHDYTALNLELGTVRNLVKQQWYRYSNDWDSQVYSTFWREPTYWNYFDRRVSDAALCKSVLFDGSTNRVGIIF